MMNITLKSAVDGELKSIYSQFNADLFRYLLPPGAQLIEFGGAKKGDYVHLRLPLGGEWVSEIVEDGSSEDKFYFIDVGRKLPFPLKEWRHIHILQSEGSKTIIIDTMNFSTGSGLMDILFYPFIFLAFLLRIWQYKHYFRAARGVS